MKILNDNRQVKIIDTTLRDGEQTPGISFSFDEKIKIAQYLDLLGVDFIEVGTPASGVEEQQAIEKILKLNLNAKIITWNRALITDIQKSIECGSRYIHISLPVSDIHIDTKLQKNRKWVMNALEVAGNYLQREGIPFSVGAEDASRGDNDFLISYTVLAKELGAKRLRYCDTVGVLNPFILNDRLSKLIRSVDIPIEVHTHNDFGMATANALAGVFAGVEYIDTTIVGLGERAGNAAIEEVVMALKYTMGICPNIDCSLFKEVSQFMSKVTGKDIPMWKPIVGQYVFTHESGIHADGVLKNPKNYEPFPPEEVGNQRRILIGKHSGKHAILERFKELGVKIDKGECVTILQKVKKSAVSLKGSVPDSELMRIYEDEKNKRR